MSVLICKNIKAEGPGTIEDYLIAQEIHYKIVDLSMGEKIINPENFDTLIMMGGPMSVNDDIDYIREEESLVMDFITKGKKVLGICLGAQIMARALGARVYAGEEKEVGWYDIELTEEGLNDQFMRRLATHPQTGDIWKRFRVFHWHGETFDIPQGAVRLAGSSLYTNQAFRYGNNAYAFQFHIEVSKEMIYDWFKNEPANLDRLKGETERSYDIYNKRAMRFYESFFGKSRNG
ncbi:MAG: type 1 glutamine amidotransferase [Thermodesulfovibrionia bacterium]